MEAKDLVAYVAFILSLVNAVVLYFHNQRMREFASAAPEISILATINAARVKSEDMMLKLVEHLKGRRPDKLTADEKRHFEELIKLHHSNLEVLLNSYELACRLYRSNKIDRVSFRAQYSEEVRELFESELDYYKTRLHPITSSYTALRAVYGEWFKQP